MTEDQLDNQLSNKSKPLTALWVVVLVLFLACAAIIVGLWSSFRSDTTNRQLALLKDAESGEVLGAITTDPQYLTSLADNLKSTGIVLYGFDGNTETKKQVSIFGQAIGGLDYVECNSQSAHANADECVAKGIEKYPTWVKGDEKMVGYKTLSDLEKLLAN